MADTQQIASSGYRSSDLALAGIKRGSYVNLTRVFYPNL